MTYNTKTYKIIRFRNNGNNTTRRVIKTGLTLEQAKEHCNDPATSGLNWFDGYDLE